MDKKIKTKKILIHGALICGALIMIVPFLWMVLTSLKTMGEATQVPPKIFPSKPMYENYSEVSRLLPFGKFYMNTIIMLIFRVVGSVFFSAMAAYAFARLNFPGKKIFFALVLFLLVQKLGLLNTISALVIPGIVSAFGTFLLRQFFMGLPKELEEAAKLDGCNTWQTFYKVMLPLARSGLVALGIFTALFAFKDLMWPLVVNMSVDKMTLSAGLASLQGQFSTNYPQLMAGSVLAIWPMLIIFVIFQRKFIEGIATSGSKL